MDGLDPLAKVRCHGLVVVRRLSDAIAGRQQQRIRLIDHFGGDNSRTVQEFKLFFLGRFGFVRSHANPL